MDRSVSCFAQSIDAMLGAELAQPYKDVQGRVEAAQSLEELTAAVRGALGQPARAVNRADREFDFTPYQLASEDYTSTLSKLRRKSVLRKFKDDPDGALEELSRRSEALTTKINTLLALYGPFFDEPTTAAFVDNLALITAAEDLETQLNAVRELPASGDLDRVIGDVNALLSARPTSLRPSPTIAPCGKSPGGRCPSVLRNLYPRTPPTCCASPSLIWDPVKAHGSFLPISATAFPPTKCRRCPWASPPSS